MGGKQIRKRKESKYNLNIVLTTSIIKVNIKQGEVKKWKDHRQIVREMFYNGEDRQTGSDRQRL